MWWMKIELQQRVGITFVFATHDQEEALTLSDRIAVMNEGDPGVARYLNNNQMENDILTVSVKLAAGL